MKINIHILDVQYNTYVYKEVEITVVTAGFSFSYVLTCSASMTLPSNVRSFIKVKHDTAALSLSNLMKIFNTIKSSKVFVMMSIRV